MEGAKNVYKKMKNIKGRLGRIYQLRQTAPGNHEYFFHLDTPQYETSNRENVLVSGWFVSNKRFVKLRVLLPSGKYKQLWLRVPRKDVVDSFARDGRKVPLRSGFSIELRQFHDGLHRIQVAHRMNQWTDVHHMQLKFDRNFTAEPSQVPIKVADTSEDRYTSHLDQLAAKKQYFYESAATKDLVLQENDPKLIAFYLPQFHAIPENDTWWGKGFTEWQNVGAAIPRFIGHEQPRVPADLGYYNLLDIKTHRAQAELAKQHGLYGFCYYYYWFSGKRLLEQPLDLILKDKKFDFNFMICWANENWTRRWDGLNKDILIKQENKKSDPLAFIKDVEHILTDKRYIHIDGKPALMVYRAEDLGDPKRYTDIWRDYFRKKHNLELHLIAVRSFSLADDVQSLGFDKGLEFTPLSLNKPGAQLLVKYPFEDKLLDGKFGGWSFDYRKLVHEIVKDQSPTKNYLTVMPSWDNDSRRKGKEGSTVFYGSTPDLYGYWLAQTIRRSHDNGTDITFINAWNEWAEGAILEPTMQYGHAYLNRTSEIVASFSNGKNKDNYPLQTIKRTEGVTTAIVVHLYYTDLWPKFEEHLALLDQKDYDLFVSVPEDKAREIIPAIQAFNKHAYIYKTPNRGRDVLPFIHIVPRLDDAGYEYVLKLHSKKSHHREDGHTWLDDMLDKLMPADRTLQKNIISTLKKKDTGLIGPKGHFISLGGYLGGNKRQITEVLDEIIGNQQKTDAVVNASDKIGFFAGTMFWARMESIRPLVSRRYHAGDFEMENGQLDATFAHTIERLFGVIPYVNHRVMYEIGRESSKPAALKQKDIIVRYKYASPEMRSKKGEKDSRVKRSAKK